MNASKKTVLLLLFTLLMAGIAWGALAFAAHDDAGTPATRGITASLWCDFAGPGRRGVCSANPRGAGFTYSFYASGSVSVAGGLPSHADRSATCSGYGTVTVVVTNAAGESDSASFSTSCSGGSR